MRYGDVMLKTLFLASLLFLVSCLAPDKGIEVDKKTKAPTTDNGVSAATSYRLVMSGPSSITNGDCTLVVINSLDSEFQSYEPTSALTVNLSTVGAGSFFSDSSCGTATATAIIPPASSSVSVYFQSSAIGSMTLKAQATKFATAIISLQAIAPSVTSAPAATKLKINGPQYTMTDVCLPLALNLLDQNSNSFEALGATPVTLSGMANFYSNSTCTTTISSVTLAAGEYQKMLYTKTSTAGAYVISASSSGLIGEIFPLFVSPQNTTAVSEYGLQMLGSSLIEEGQCSPVSINLLGSNAAPMLAASAKPLTLSGTILGDLYTNSSCTTNLSSLSALSIASASTSAVFYVKPSSAGNLNLNATSAGLIPASLAITVKPAVSAPTLHAAKVKVYGSQNQQSNMCAALNLVLQDQNNNSFLSVGSTVVSFGGVSSLYSDAACSSTITSLTLNNGESNKIFYAKSATAGGYVLTSSSAGLTSDYFPIIVTDPPGAASVTESSLQLAGPNQFQATLCAPFNVNLMGSNGAPVLASANKTITLSGISLGQVYSDSSCTTNLASLSSLSISSGTSSTSFYIKAPSATNIILGASTAGLIPANLSILVTNAPSTTTPVEKKLKLSGTQNLQKDMCAPLNVSLLDQNNNAIDATLAKTINLSGVSNTYSDSGCTSTTTSVSLAIGESSKLFYVKVSTAGGYVLTSSSGILTSDTFPLVVVEPPSTPTIVESSLQLSGPNQFQATLCAPFNVNLFGSTGSPILATSNKTVTLSGVSLGQVYSDSGCTTNLASLSSLTINAGTASAVFYIKASLPTNIILGANTAGLIPANLSILVTAAPSVVTPVETKLKVSGAQNLQESMCAPLNVSLLDQNNNAIGAASGRTVSLSGISSSYSDSACSTTTTSLSFAAGESNKIFYAKISSPGGYLLTASSGGVSSDQFPLVVTAPPSAPVVSETSLQFSGPSQFSTSLCAPFVVNLLGSNGLPIIATANKTITLSGTALANFYTDNSCSSPLATLSSLSILSGSTHAIFYLKMSTPASIVLGASTPGLTSATLSALVTLASSAPVEQSMAAQGSYTADIGECVPMSATVLNSNGVPVAIAANRTVNLASSNANLEIFSDPVCSSATGSLTMLAGESLLNYYVKGLNAGNFMVTLSSTGLISANHPIKVLSQAGAPVPYKLYLSTVAQAVHDNCTPAIVSSLDYSGNAINVTANKTVALTAAGDITYYSDSGCSLATSSVTINNATSSRTFYFKANSGLSAILQASTSGLADSLFNLSVVPPSGATGSPVQLRLSGVSGLYTESCNIFQVQTVDENGVPRNVAVDKTINLGGAGAGAFYSDNACTSTVTGTTITTGTNSKTVYYKNLTVENLLLTAQTSGLIGTTFSVVMTRNPESLGGFKLEGQQNILTSSCVPYIVTALKNSGSVKVLTADQTFTLNSSAGVSWYTNGTCTTPATTPTIVNGQSSATYYLKVTTPGNYLLSASSAPLNSGVLGVSVTTSSTDVGINFEDVNFRVIESQGTLKLKILLTSPSPTGVVIPFTVSGSATRPQDHNLASGTVAISAGQSFGYINFSIVDDATSESEEDIVITLGSAPIGYYNGFNNVLAISIYDNDNGGTSVATSGIRYKKIDMGGNHACAVLESGAVKCWGYNIYGQLGDGTTTNSKTPVDVMGVNDAIDVSVGVNHSCILTSSGAVKCWGYNGYGNLGDGTTVNKSSVVSSLNVTSGIIKIQSSDSNVCALSNTGALWCWGYGGQYQHGFNTGTVSTPTQVTGFNAPVVQFALSDTRMGYALTSSGTLYSWGQNTDTVGNLGRGSLGTSVYLPGIVISSGVSSLPAGLSRLPELSMCVVMTSGGIKCWGQNNSGQLGDGTSTNNVIPTDVLGINSGVSNVYMGTNNTCALLFNGELRCWGAYNYILGEGYTANVLAPLKIQGLHGVISEFILGIYNACAIYTTGALDCWGYNAYGQVGDGTNLLRYNPVPVDGFTTSGAKSLSSSDGTKVCAITNTGKIKCWGSNGSFGVLGDGTTVNRYTPTPIVEAGVSFSIKGLSSIASGGKTSCGLLTGFNLLGCWGENNNGQLGIGSTTRSQLTLVDIGVVSQYSVGENHTCAVTSSGGLKCWGSNSQYQLGDGTNTVKNTPQSVSSLSSGVAYVSAGSMHTCAVTTGGGAKCWGYQASYYQLGDGTTSTRTTPVDVTGLTSGVAKIAAGSNHTCALTTGSGLKCWGYGPAVGDGTGGTKTTAVNVTGLTSNVSDIVSGEDFSCALTTSGGVKCWGINTSGRLGDSTVTQRNAPVDVTGLTSGVKAISTSSGSTHACAITSTNNMVCWGGNASGQLGNGTTTASSSPVSVLGVGTVKSISVGIGHSCAILLGTNELKCWGSNASTQLGNGKTIDSLSAISPLYPPNSESGVPKIYTGPKHSCMTYADQLYCWGANNYGQLGQGTASSYEMTAMKSVISYPLDKVVIGEEHTCVLLKGGALSCFGRNNRGQLGDGTNTNRTSPYKVILSNVNNFAAGDAFTCANGGMGMKCWGANSDGQLGDGTYTDQNVPTAVLTNKNFTGDIFANGRTVCANAGGNSYCWGDNGSNQFGLGYNGISSSNTPVQLSMTFKEMGIGQEHICGIRTIGETNSLYCSGYNNYGQLGSSDGDKEVFYPVQNLPAELKNPVGLQVGQYHSCARDEGSGKLFCWGRNNYGQLGQARFATTFSPKYVPGTDNTLTSASSWNHLCFIQKIPLSIGVKPPQCFGYGQDGQLGNNDTQDINVPVFVQGTP